MPTDTWDDFAAGWDAEPDVQQYADKAYNSWQRRVAPLIENVSEIKALDFGCGTGLLTERLAAHCHEIVAVDSSGRMIDVLDGKIAESGSGNISSLVTTIDQSSIRAHRNLLSKFDLVVASSVCSFLPDFEETLFDIATIMSPDSIFVHWDWLEELPIDTVRAAFSKAGLNCLRIDKEFDMAGRSGPASVVMGIGPLVV
jgi:2-polyprenyl-3-methyl-5-hydroxy-6-metoxy-1,4-benzoquinol methylase